MHYILIALFTVLLSYTPTLASVDVTPGISEDSNVNLKYVALNNKFQFGDISLPFNASEEYNCARLQIFLGFIAAGMQGANNEEMFKENVLQLQGTLVNIFQDSKNHPFLFSVLGSEGFGKMHPSPTTVYNEAIKHFKELDRIVRAESCSCSQIDDRYECLFPNTGRSITEVNIPDLLIYHAQFSNTFLPSYFSNIDYTECSSLTPPQFINCSVQKIKDARVASGVSIVPTTDGSKSLPGGQGGLKTTSSDEESAGFIHQLPSFVLFFISAVLAYGWAL